MQTEHCMLLKTHFKRTILRIKYMKINPVLQGGTGVLYFILRVEWGWKD